MTFNKMTLLYEAEGLKFEWSTKHTVNVFRTWDLKNVDAYSIGNFKTNETTMNDFIKSTKRYLKEHE